MSGWQLIPLRWMKPSAEQPQATESTADCTYSNQSSKTCTTETRDGVAYERCKAYFSLMRNCPGRPAEEVMKKETETLRMLGDTEANDTATGPGTSNPLPPLAPDVGQMFDEFFSFAADVERNLTGTFGDKSGIYDRNAGKGSVATQGGSKFDMFEVNFRHV